jgi:hypothetical protein
MDINDGFTTSSKEKLRSLVRVHELDEIISNGGVGDSPRGPLKQQENPHLKPATTR